MVNLNNMYNNLVLIYGIRKISRQMPLKGIEVWEYEEVKMEVRR